MINFPKNFFLFFVSIITLSGSSCNNPDDEYKPESKETPYEMGAKVADFLKSADKVKRVLFFQGAKDANLLNPSDIKLKDVLNMFNELSAEQKSEFCDSIEKEEKLVSTYFNKKIKKDDPDAILADLTKLISKKDFWGNLSDTQKKEYKDKFSVINKAIQSK